MKRLECIAMIGLLALTSAGNGQSGDTDGSRGIGNRVRESIGRLKPLGKDKGRETAAATAQAPDTAQPFTGPTPTALPGNPPPAPPADDHAVPPLRGQNAAARQVSPSDTMFPSGVHHPSEESIRRLSRTRDANSTLHSSSVRSELTAASKDLESAIKAKDNQKIDQYMGIMKTKVDDLPNVSKDLPINDRHRTDAAARYFKIGLQRIEEGRDRKEDCKIQMGLEALEQGNASFEDAPSE